MQLTRVSCLALLALVTTSGCAGYTQHHGHVHHTSSSSRGGEALALGIGVLAGAAIVAASDRHSPREPEVVVEQRIYYVTTGPQAPATPASPRDRVAADDGLPSFDPVVARSALSAVDVSSCKEPGSAPGYGHATVTFNPDGVISKVVIDEPSGLTAAAVQCIGDRLGAVTLAPFRGCLVTVGTVFRR